MHGTLTLRDATPEDASVIAEIYNATLIPGDALKIAEEVQMEIEGFSRRETYLLLEREGVVIGWGLIKRYSPRGGYRFCAETGIYLRPSEVGQGYGSHLKHALIERCKHYGYHHLIARLFADNPACLALYRRFGYQQVGLQKEICFSKGRWLDIAVMQCLLEDVPPLIPAADREES